MVICYSTRLMCGKRKNSQMAMPRLKTLCSTCHFCMMSRLCNIYKNLWAICYFFKVGIFFFLLQSTCSISAYDVLGDVHLLGSWWVSRNMSEGGDSCKCAETLLWQIQWIFIISVCCWVIWDDDALNFHKRSSGLSTNKSFAQKCRRDSWKWYIAISSKLQKNKSIVIIILWYKFRAYHEKINT